MQNDKQKKGCTCSFHTIPPASLAEGVSFMQRKNRYPKFITVDLSSNFIKAYDIEHGLFMAPDGRVRNACSIDFTTMTPSGMSPPLLKRLLTGRSP